MQPPGPIPAAEHRLPRLGEGIHRNPCRQRDIIGDVEGGVIRNLNVEIAVEVQRLAQPAWPRNKRRGSKRVLVLAAHAVVSIAALVHDRFSHEAFQPLEIVIGHQVVGDISQGRSGERQQRHSLAMNASTNRLLIEWCFRGGSSFSCYARDKTSTPRRRASRCKSRFCSRCRSTGRSPRERSPVPLPGTGSS